MQLSTLPASSAQVGTLDAAPPRRSVITRRGLIDELELLSERLSAIEAQLGQMPAVERVEIEASGRMTLRGRVVGFLWPTAALANQIAAREFFDRAVDLDEAADKIIDIREELDGLIEELGEPPPSSAVPAPNP